MSIIRNNADAKKKTILNMETGIYYNGVAEAAETVSMKIGTLRSMLNGGLKNRTPLLYV